ncbi:uncharacterized protein LOC126379927 isoform X2 [Pectinophora gossypiella]|nr:uncharacterized protein LOC126379927 isoform X2 [Pectinophora gossypiella]
MLLHRPKDISSECAFSQKLRYDISFGGGMSDTITLVLRTLSEIDYECQIEIVTDRNVPNIIIVIRFPNYVGTICQANPHGFMLLKKDRCYLLCDQVEEKEFYTYYFVTVVSRRFRFTFINNSSINSDMDANMYEVTATSARVLGDNETCREFLNETKCTIDNENFCVTNGVVCDGINNCGAKDWFDEKLSGCSMEAQTLGITPVIAIGSLAVCALLIMIHMLLHYLPPLAKSFFIFNANEDNRFCIDPTLKPPFHKMNDDHFSTRSKSLVPVFSSTSSSGDEEEESKTYKSDQVPSTSSIKRDLREELQKKSALQLISGTFRSVAEKLWLPLPSPRPQRSQQN